MALMSFNTRLVSNRSNNQEHVSHTTNGYRDMVAAAGWPSSKNIKGDFIED